MSMAEAIQVLNRMEEDGIIKRYAIGGAVAALNYVEARFTRDLDILITFEHARPSGLVTLGPITRVLSPEHLTAIAVRTGRPKDYIRIDDFIEQEAVDLKRLFDVLERHDLTGRWAEFCRKTGRPDPLALGDRT